MNINITKTINKNVIYFVIDKKHKIKEKDLKMFANDFKFPKWKNFKIETFSKIENNKKNTKILVFVKNKDKFKKHIEDIVIELWNIIMLKNTKFSMSLKWLNIDIILQQLFLELLAQKFYKFSEFKDQNIKYVLNVDTNIDKEKFVKKIESIYFARDLMNKPANVLNPKTYEEIINKTFKKNQDINIKVIKWIELKNMWAWGIYSVWKWSLYEPRLIILEYKPNETDDFNILVGKWVTFDSWWYNIKPTGYMEDMHLDMWWSAVALWIFKYLVETWYKKNLVCAVWLVENLVSDKAYTPTDIIKMYNGKTVQIYNTDAEWRLVLADLLSYVEDKYKINKVFDFATLTWAAIVALWEDITVIEWRNSKILNDIKKISWELSEPTWELPLFVKYKKKLKSNFADISNCSKSRWAWTITAWLFLSEFIKNKNWVHFDIAWPEIVENNPLYWNGGSGIIIRTVINFFEQE